MNLKNILNKEKIILKSYNEKNNKFLNEYPCTYIDEYKFLQAKGFRYSFVKVIDGVTTWKYKKSESLYEALQEYYNKNK